MKRTVLAPGLVLAIAVLTGGWFLQQGVDNERNLYSEARLLQEVIDRVSNTFVDEVDRDDLYGSAIDGIMEKLDDPNSSFIEARQWENLGIRIEGEYGGVGLEIVLRDDWVTVVTTMPAS